MFLFAVNTGLRPDEAWRLQFRDVPIVYDEDLKKTILEIEVRGKRGIGYCKSTPGAVSLSKRLRSRLRPARIYGANAPTGTSETSVVPSGQWRTPEPTDLIFPKWQRELFKTILDEEKLRLDREAPTAHGVQPTAYIHLPALDGRCRHLPNRQELPHQCRDDRKVYASHIKTSLDAVAINVMRPKKRKSKQARLTEVA